MKHIIDTTLFLGLLAILFFVLRIAGNDISGLDDARAKAHWERQAAIAEIINSKFGVKRER